MRIIYAHHVVNPQKDMRQEKDVFEHLRQQYRCLQCFGIQMNCLSFFLRAYLENKCIEHTSLNVFTTYVHLLGYSVCLSSPEFI